MCQQYNVTESKSLVQFCLAVSFADVSAGNATCVGPTDCKKWCRDIGDYNSVLGDLCARADNLTRYQGIKSFKKYYGGQKGAIVLRARILNA
jgi:hypothetical protein